LGAFGEEYGWRGYLTPKLAGRLGWFWASVLVGIIWAVWHAPSILFGYEYGWYMRPEGVLLFVPVTCGVAVIHTAVYLRWGVWGAALTHGAVNSWAVIYYVLYPRLLPDRWLWGPVGLQGAATAWLVAALTWIYTKRQVRSLQRRRTPAAPPPALVDDPQRRSRQEYTSALKRRRPGTDDDSGRRPPGRPSPRLPGERAGCGLGVLPPGPPPFPRMPRSPRPYGRSSLGTDAPPDRGSSVSPDGTPLKPPPGPGFGPPKPRAAFRRRTAGAPCSPPPCLYLSVFIKVFPSRRPPAFLSPLRRRALDLLRSCCRVRSIRRLSF